MQTEMYKRQIIQMVASLEDSVKLEMIVNKLLSFQHTEDSKGYIWDLANVDDTVIQEIYDLLQNDISASIAINIDADNDNTTKNKSKSSELLNYKNNEDEDEIDGIIVDDFNDEDLGECYEDGELEEDCCECEIY